MKKLNAIVIVVSLLFPLFLIAQDEKKSEETVGAPLVDAQSEKKPEETVGAPLVDAQSEKKSEEVEKVVPVEKQMTAEEIQSLVKTMVDTELQKRDAEQQKKDEADKKAKEAVVAQEKKAKDEKGKKKDLTPEYGFILPQFTKSSISFIMGDDNLRDNSQYSPKWDIGYRDEYEDFYDRFYGYNNLGGAATRLTLFHQADSWLPNTTVNLGISLKIGVRMEALTDHVETFLKEDGSYIMTNTVIGKHRINFTFYPFSADRIAIGYFRGMRWGTKEVFPQNATIVPGFQTLYGYGPFSFYFGFKAHMQDKVDKLSRELVPKEAVYGFFGGVTYKDENGITGKLQGAFINKGENVILPDELLNNADDDTILSYGIDAFLQYNWGSELGDPIGINSYGDREWINPVYDKSFSFRTRGEYMFLNERLMNGDYLGYENDSSDVSVTDNYMAHAGALELSGRWRDLRLFTLFSYRTLEYLTFDAPGVNPFTTLPGEADKSDEIAFSVTADYHVWLFWFGATFGYKKPATYTVYDASGQKQVTVIKDRLLTDSVSNAFSRTREVLPEGRDALDIMFVAANVRFELSRHLNASLEYRFTQDHNRAKMVETTHSDGTGTGVFEYDWDDEEVRNIHSLFFSVEGRF